MSFVSVYVFNFSEVLHYIVIKQVDTSVHNCDIGVPRDYHVILCSTFESLFEFQKRIFLEFVVRVSSCSNIKPFEVRGSTAFILLFVVYLTTLSVDQATCRQIIG
jgi:hypothetical protein